MTTDTISNGSRTHTQSAAVNGDADVPSRGARSAELIVRDEGPNAILLDTARFRQAQQVAKLMASSSLVPDHLAYVGPKNNQTMLSPEARVANCFRVVNQALRWGFDPFGIIDCTYVVGGKLGYEGKLVAAVVNTRAGLKGRLSATYRGDEDDRTVTISGHIDGEQEPRTVDLRLGDAKTSNAMWTKDPDQKLWYSGVTKWARRHTPEVLLGVLTDDDLERMISSQRIVGERITESATESRLNDLVDKLPGLDGPTDRGGLTEGAHDTDGTTDGQEHREDTEAPTDGQDDTDAPTVGHDGTDHRPTAGANGTEGMEASDRGFVDGGGGTADPADAAGRTTEPETAEAAPFVDGSSEGVAAGTVDPHAELRTRPGEGIASWTSRLSDSIKAAATRHRLREIREFLDAEHEAGNLRKSPYGNLLRDIDRRRDELKGDW